MEALTSGDTTNRRNNSYTTAKKKHILMETVNRASPSGGGCGDCVDVGVGGCVC